MKTLVVLLGMLACLIGPTAIFTLVGYNALKTVGRRTSSSGRAMVILITKLSITAVFLIGILMVLLKVFA